jgi:hypothetical protein
MDEAAGVVSDDRPCLACGYSLRGLSAAANCPECGRAVALSLRGNLLRYSSAEYVASLHRGVVLVQAGIIAQVVLVILGIVGAAVMSGPGFKMDPSLLKAANAAAQVAIAAAGVVGWWLLSSPDPAYVGAENGATARKVVRVTVAISAVAALLPLIAGQANVVAVLRGSALTAAMTLALAVMAANMVAMVVWFFAAMRYLRWMAPRLPDARVDQRAKLLMWLNPVLIVLLWVVCGLGPLIALILYYNLLEWVRKDLKAVRSEQAAGVA